MKLKKTVLTALLVLLMGGVAQADYFQSKTTNQTGVSAFTGSYSPEKNVYENTIDTTAIGAMSDVTNITKTSKRQSDNHFDVLTYNEDRAVSKTELTSKENNVYDNTVSTTVIGASANVTNKNSSSDQFSSFYVKTINQENAAVTASTKLLSSDDSIYSNTLETVAIGATASIVSEISGNGSLDKNQEQRFDATTTNYGYVGSVMTIDSDSDISKNEVTTFSIGASTNIENLNVSAKQDMKYYADTSNSTGSNVYASSNLYSAAGAIFKNNMNTVAIGASTTIDNAMR